MKKILFIDLFCEYGHNNINKIYIKNLLQKGYVVEIAMQESYFNTLDLDVNLLKIKLPEKYFKLKQNRLIGRLNQVLLLKYISKNITKEKYDFLFFTYFEEISFYLSGISFKSYLMVHGNAESFDNFIKRFFLKKIGNMSNINFLIFTNHISKKFTHHKLSNFVVENHGIPNPITCDSSISKNHFKKLLEKNKHFLKPEYKYIFIPNSNKFGFNFLEELLSQDFFLKNIITNNIYILVKGGDVRCNENIIELPEYLNDDDFNSILINSNIIFLNYPKSFENRVSGLFFECISNNKILLLPRIHSFTEFQNYFNYDPFYDNCDNLFNKISKLLKLNDNPYNNKQNMNPKLSNLI